MFQMSFYHNYDYFTQLLFVHAELKKKIAKFLENSNYSGEISQLKLEIDKLVKSLLYSLLWTKESTLWKTALRIANNPLPINEKNSFNELYRIILLSTICTKLIFSEISAIVASKRRRES